MNRQEWIKEFDLGYCNYHIITLTDKDCKELSDLLKEKD